MEVDGHSSSSDLCRAINIPAMTEALLANAAYERQAGDHTVLVRSIPDGLGGSFISLRIMRANGMIVGSELFADMKQFASQATAWIQSLDLAG
jgi:hypothetical protein